MGAMKLLYTERCLGLPRTRYNPQPPPDVPHDPEPATLEALPAPEQPRAERRPERQGLLF